MNVDKVSKACSSTSNNSPNDISDGNKTIKSTLSCKRVLCSSGAAKTSTSKKNEVKSSSSNTTRTWNESCRRFLCSFGGSKSKPSNPAWIGSKKKIEIRSLVKGSTKNESRLLMNKSLVASPKHVIPRSNIKEKESGQTDSSNASKPSQIQKTAVPKDPAPNKLRNKVEKSEVSKDSAVTTGKKTDIPKDSLIGTQKTETQRAEKQKTCLSEIPIKMTDITKTLNPCYEEKNHPSSSHYQPYSDIPVNHIRWDGHDDEHDPPGHKCVLCEKDLLRSPNGVDRGSREYNDYKYQIHFRPQILPAVDILPCGHVFHTECSKFAIPEEESTDPQCVFCLSMV